MTKYRTLESTIRHGGERGSTYKSFRSSLKTIFEKKIETHYRDQIVVGSYVTSHFEMSPKAQLLYSSLPDDVNRAAAEKSAVLLDRLFALEKSVIATKKATSEDIAQAEAYAQKVLIVAMQAGMEDQHKKIVQDSVDTIKSLHKVENLNPKENPSDKEIKNKFTRPSLSQTPEPNDMDIDNQKFRISRSLQMQRKLKIIDND